MVNWQVNPSELSLSLVCSRFLDFFSLFLDFMKSFLVRYSYRSLIEREALINCKGTNIQITDTYLDRKIVKRVG